MSVSENFWVGVPIDKLPQWQAAFNRQVDILIPSPCPVCGENKLRQYYHLEKNQPVVLRGIFFIGQGSYWSWCANCGAYEHASSFIPADWIGAVLPVDHSLLTPLPTELESAIGGQQ
jgi:hypothetical protein